MSGVLVSLEQNSPEWMVWRKDGIGGSDAPVVEGLSPYRTKRQLFFEKSGKSVLEDDESKKFIFDKGHKVEGMVRKEFEALVGAEMSPVCMEHSEFKYLRASLDGLDSKYGVLEAKLVGKEDLQAAREGNIPVHHYSQMQHQFAVSGADIGQWFGHDGKKAGVLLEVRPNQEYIKRLLDKEHQFWSDLKAGKTPELSERDYLEPEDTTLLKELRDAKELAENAALAFERLKEFVVNTYGGHPKIAGGGIIMFKSTRQGSLNLLKVPEVSQAAESIKTSLKPEYLETFRGKGSESWTVKINGGLQ